MTIFAGFQFRLEFNISKKKSVIFSFLAYKYSFLPLLRHTQVNNQNCEKLLKAVGIISWVPLANHIFLCLRMQRSLFNNFFYKGRFENIDRFQMHF